jgi:hypothetical protein
MLSSSVVASQEGYKRSFHAADRRIDQREFLENKMISYIEEILQRRKPRNNREKWVLQRTL